MRLLAHSRTRAAASAVVVGVATASGRARVGAHVPARGVERVARRTRERTRDEARRGRRRRAACRVSRARARARRRRMSRNDSSSVVVLNPKPYTPTTMDYKDASHFRWYKTTTMFSRNKFQKMYNTHQKTDTSRILPHTSPTHHAAASSPRKTPHGPTTDDDARRRDRCSVDSPDERCGARYPVRSVRTRATRAIRANRARRVRSTRKRKISRDLKLRRRVALGRSPRRATRVTDD